MDIVECIVGEDHSISWKNKLIRKDLNEPIQLDISSEGGLNKRKKRKDAYDLGRHGYDFDSEIATLQAMKQ